MWYSGEFGWEWSHCERAELKFWAPTLGVPQIYEAYCLCISTAKPLQAKQRDLGSVWPITAHGQICKPEAQAERKRACGQECMCTTKSLTSCPSPPPHGLTTHSVRLCEYETQTQLCAHTYWFLFRQVCWHHDHRLQHSRDGFCFHLPLAAEALKSSASAKG